jgi:hypothetical protein
MTKLVAIVLATAFCLSWAEGLWADEKDNRDGRDTQDLQAWSVTIDAPRRFVVLKDFKEGHFPPQNPFIGVLGDETRYWSITAGSVNNVPGRFAVATNVGNPTNTVSTVAPEQDLSGAQHPSWCVRGPGGGQSSREP